MAAYISFQPKDHYKSTTYTGTGSELALTNVGFEADWTLLKDKTDANAWSLFDSVRVATKYLKTSGTNIEGTDAQYLKSWESTGFTVGTSVAVNDSGNEYGAWNFKGGTTTGIGGSPSITPTGYSFNQTAGFSVVTYTANNTAGATIPHGLGVAPRYAIIKCLDYAEAWTVYVAPMDPTADFSLNSDAAGAATDNFHDTLPTSTLFYLSNGGEVYESSRTYVAYFFADKKGFSRVGRYQGNGNADGTFVYTGFRPGLLMLKRDGVQQWQLYNSAMGVNGSIVNFYPDSNEVATPTSGSMDLLSNGFKCRTSSAAVNSDSAFYYIAISEWPFVSSNDVPGVAR